MASKDTNSRKAKESSDKNEKMYKYTSKLTFIHLYEFWDGERNSDSVGRRAVAEEVLRLVPEGHPLREEVVSIETCHEYAELVDLLLSAVIPTATRDTDYAAAFIPFSDQVAFATEPFVELMNQPDALAEQTHAEFDINKTQAAFSVILNVFYGAGREITQDYIVEVRDPDTKLSRYYRAAIDPQFVRIVVNGDLPQLSAEDINRLADNPADLDLHYEMLPVELFEFHGFSLITIVDVTVGESLSRLKQDLLAQNALMSEKRMRRIQRRIRSLLGRPDIRLGVIALDRCDDGNVSGARKIGRSILLNLGMPECSHPEETLYFKVFTGKQSLVANGLSRMDGPSGFMQHIINEGVESLYLAPLMKDDMPIGMMEIGSPHDGDLSALMIPLLDEISGLFATALKRSLDEQEDRVQAIIKRQYTAIHPVVEWKFRRVALEMMANESGKQPDIRFEDVHSLFGTSDIRGSSVIRSIAIQQDVAEQLGLALAVVIAASTVRPRPFLDELGFRISSSIEGILERVDSGDELSYTAFLRDEVEPLFEEFAAWSPDVQAAVDRYWSALDKDRGVLYEKRRAFDDSVGMINEAIGHFMAEKQQDAQDMIPHYFEMYRTDGAEYTLYAGSSLLNNRPFSALDLKNLRLWQLITMAGLARTSAALLPELPVKLETAQLVLVQSSPVDIRFRADEKKFDVDGAYNVRYEIVKKRIDKATIQGTGERLTQPGTVSIVYSQKAEEAEYEQYLKYLFAAGYFEGELEKVELDALPGVTGLKAFRIKVALEEGFTESFPIPDPAAERPEKSSGDEEPAEA